MENTTLRNIIEQSKADYLKERGTLDRRWNEEGIVWALEDYWDSKGSVLTFSEDDWLVCKENGLSLYDVIDHSCETWFHEEMGQIGRYMELALECWRNEDLDGRGEDLIPDEDIPKDVVLGFINDFFTWRKDKLPMIRKIYEGK